MTTALAVADTTVVIHLYRRYAPALTWYGSLSSNPEGSRLSATPVTATTGPVSNTYEFIKDAGSWVSYKDFDTFKLMTPDFSVLAIANLPANAVTGSTSVPNGSAPKSPTTSVPNNSNGGTSTEKSGAASYFPVLSILTLIPYMILIVCIHTMH